MKLRGLILKDVFELWTQNRILIVMIFIYLLISLFSEGGRMLGSVAMLLLGILAIASGAAIQTAGALLTGKTAWLHSIPLSSLGALIYLCTSLPLMFHLGLEKGRIFLMLLSAGFLALSGLFLT